MTNWFAKLFQSCNLPLHGGIFFGQVVLLEASLLYEIN